MRIDRIDLWHVAVPLPSPFRPAWIPGLVQTDNRFDLARLTTASGLEGWSAAPRMGRERSGLGALLGPYFLGERADDIANVRQRIREMGYLGWNAGWLEPACWDIVGKARNRSVCQLLGGHGGPVRVYASSGEVRSGNARAAEIEARLAEGFDAVKLRVHAETLAEDVAQIREARAAVGDGPVLGVDANQGWRVAAIADAPHWDYDRALSFCRAAEDLGVTWVEEPLAMDDYRGLARLRRATDLAIAGGELNGQGLPEFQVMLDRGCLDWYQPDAVFTGGIAATWAIVRQVNAARAVYSPHTWTNGIGFAVNLQIFAASPNREADRLEYPLDPPGWVPEARDGLLVEPWRHQKGEIVVADRPGLGFDIDRRALRRYGARFFTATKARVAIHAVLDRGLAEARELGEVRRHRLEARSRALDEGGTDPALEALRELELEAPQSPANRRRGPGPGLGQRGAGVTASSVARAFAPATVSNVACGFDIFGFALESPGDEVTVRPTAEPGVTIASIIGDSGRLPIEPDRNSAGAAVLALLAAHASERGIALDLDKKMPLASGLGSSAASAVAAVVAANEALELGLERADLLRYAVEGERAACGSPHADNAAPSLLGGFVLVRGTEPRHVCRLPVPQGLSVAVLRPHLEVPTGAARALLGDSVRLRDAVTQWGNVAALVTGLHRGDWDLISDSLVDVIAEPLRTPQIPGFDQIRRAALDRGALGCSLSGSGPSLFALCRSLNDAWVVAEAMVGAATAADLECDHIVSVVGCGGARLLPPPAAAA